MVIGLAALPAAAASPEKPNLRLTNVTAGAYTTYIPGYAPPNPPPYWIDGHQAFSYLDGNLTAGLEYFAPNPNALVTSITVTLTVQDASGMKSEKPTVRSGTGWSAVSGTVTGTSAVYVFSWAGSINASPQYTDKLEFRLPGDGSSKPSDLHWPKSVVTVAVSPSANSATGSASVSQPS